MRNAYTVVLRFLIAYFSILPTSAPAQQTLTSINGWNAYVHLPDDYHSTGTKTYPAIIFLPGTDETDANRTSLLVYGPASFLTSGWNGNVTVNGEIIKPIIIALQPSDLWLQPALLNLQIELIKKQYRVDPARVSLTGLSMGGWAAEFYVQADSSYAAKIASVVAIQAIRPDDNPAYPAPFAVYARNHGHWLGYEQINDLRDMQTIANTMNAASSGSATYLPTDVSGGSHCCWNTWYDPAHTDNYSINGVNGNYSIYQYMLSYPNTPGTNPAAPVKIADSAPSQPRTDSAATAEKLTAYPNPVKDVLTINWESNYQGKATISLYDLTGRNLQTISTTKDGSYFTSQLSLSAWKTGVYFLKIQLENGRIITQKIMKQ